MTPEETIRLAAVDVRERPEDDADAIDDALANFDPLLARIAELERERDEAVGLLRQWQALTYEDDYGNTGIYPDLEVEILDHATIAFLAKHPQTGGGRSRPDGAVHARRARLGAGINQVELPRRVLHVLPCRG
jgi:hypothetical protein